MSNNEGVNQPFMIGKEELVKVDEYNYLAQLITVDPSHEKEIRRRIKMGRVAFVKHSQIIKK